MAPNNGDSNGEKKWKPGLERDLYGFGFPKITGPFWGKQ